MQHLFLRMKSDLPDRPWLAAEGRRRREDGRMGGGRGGWEREGLDAAVLPRAEQIKVLPGIERVPPFMVSGRRRLIAKPHGVAQGRGLRGVHLRSAPPASRYVGDVGDSEVERAGVRADHTQFSRAPARLGAATRL